MERRGQQRENADTVGDKMERRGQQRENAGIVGGS